MEELKENYNITYTRLPSSTKNKDHIHSSSKNSPSTNNHRNDTRQRTAQEYLPLRTTGVNLRSRAGSTNVERLLSTTTSVARSEDTRVDDRRAAELGSHAGRPSLSGQAGVDGVLVVEEDEGELGSLDGNRAGTGVALDGLGLLFALQTAIGAELVTHGLTGPSKVELVCGRTGRGAEVLDPHARLGAGEVELRVVGATRIGDVVEQRELDRCTALVDRVARGVGAVAAQKQVHDLAAVLFHHFAHDQGGVVRGCGGPLTEGRLVIWGRSEEIVGLADTTVVEEDLAHADGGALEGEVDQVEPGSVRIRSTGETTAGGGIGLEHDKVLTGGTDDLRGVDVRVPEVLRRRMRLVGEESVLRGHRDNRVGASVILVVLNGDGMEMRSELGEETSRKQFVDGP